MWRVRRKPPVWVFSIELLEVSKLGKEAFRTSVHRHARRPHPYGLWIFLGKSRFLSTAPSQFGHGPADRKDVLAEERIGLTEDLEEAVSIPDAPELAWLAKTISSQFLFRDFREAQSEFKSQPPSIIYVFSASRDDPILETVNVVHRQYPGIEVRVILGDWWTGHRRTQALPSNLGTAYWFQAHDLILPELLQIFDDFQKGAEVVSPTSEAAIVETDRSNEHRPGQQTATRGSSTTLIVSDHAENRRLWADLGASMGLTTVGIRGLEEIPEGSFAIVILDHRLDAKIEEIELIRRAYPEAKLLVGLNFPCWRTVEPCLYAGIEWFVGKPFQLAGLVRTLSSAALDRR